MTFIQVQCIFNTLVLLFKRTTSGILRGADRLNFPKNLQFPPNLKIAQLCEEYPPPPKWQNESIEYHY
jgi:hypothetical protein